MGWRDDCKVELIYRGTGTKERPGGQQVGDPAADIRVTHIPTGTMVQYGESRSQHKCRTVCFEMMERAMLSAGFKDSKEPTP
jgi:protein subunit release factor A